MSELLSLLPEDLGELGDEQLANAYRVLTDARHDQEDAKCKSSPLYWLQNWTCTNNTQYLKNNLPYQAPFPRKSYFVPLFEAFETADTLFIAKTRDMMVSLSATGFSTQRAQWYKEFTIVQTASESKAAGLIEYVMAFYDNQPDWLKDRHPLKSRSSLDVAWQDGGRVMAIPSGPDKIRLWHPSRYIQDESCFLPEGEECLNSVRPVCAKIICISSAGPCSWFAAQCSR